MITINDIAGQSQIADTPPEIVELVRFLNSPIPEPSASSPRVVLNHGPAESYTEMTAESAAKFLDQLRIAVLGALANKVPVSVDTRLLPGPGGKQAVVYTVEVGWTK